MALFASRIAVGDAAGGLVDSVGWWLETTVGDAAVDSG